MLEIKDLKITFENKELIKQANLILKEREINLIQAPNGSGKSSLLKAIFKYPGYKIESGEIILNNQNITNLKTNELFQKNLYLVMQNIPEIEGVKVLSVLYKSYQKLFNKNIDISLFKNKVFELCDQYDLNKNLLERELNYNFSGGEKKELELIFLITLLPKYIFIDEIDSGLDQKNILKLKNILNFLLQENNSSILIISHIFTEKDFNFKNIYTIENKICQVKK